MSLNLAGFVTIGGSSSSGKNSSIFLTSASEIISSLALELDHTKLSNDSCGKELSPEDDKEDEEDAEYSGGESGLFLIVSRQLQPAETEEVSTFDGGDRKFLLGFRFLVDFLSG